MNHIEAMKQALEALEYMHTEKCDYMRRNKLGDPLREDAARLAIPAINALRTAIKQAEKQAPVGFMNLGHVYEMQQGRLPYGYVYPKAGTGADVAVYTTPPAAPVQDQGQSCYCPNCEALSKQLAAQPAPVQDTEAHYKGVIEGVQKLFDDKRAQWQWVGLTPEEVKYEWEAWRASLPRYAGFAKGIEAKLREKNGGQA